MIRATTLMAAARDFNTPWNEVPGILWTALKETIAMVFFTSVIVLVVGLIVGVVLHNTSARGSALFTNEKVYAAVDFVVNIGRSLPFLILMAFMIPLTRFLVGTSVGIKAAIVPMALGGIPYFARLVENALRGLPDEIVRASIVAGASKLQTITSAQLSESLPSLVGAATIQVVGLIEFSAVAGAIGAGGLGNLALAYGYQAFDDNIMLATVLSLIILVQLVQFTGNALARRVTRPRPSKGRLDHNVRRTRKDTPTTDEESKLSTNEPVNTDGPAAPGGFTIQKRTKWPWIVGGIVIVVIAVVLGITLRGGDDEGFGSHLKIGYSTAVPAQKAIIDYVNEEVAPDYGITVEAVGYGDGDTIYRATDEHQIAGHFTAHRYWTAEVNDRLGTHNFPTDAEVYTWVGSVYSSKYRNLEDVPDGAKVSIPQEPSVQAQQLDVIRRLGFIELDPSVDPLFVSVRDVTANPHNWQFTPIELISQARVYQDFDVTFSGGEGVDPSSLITNVPLPRAYSPPLTVAEDRRTDPNIVKLYEAIKDPRVQEWLNSGDGRAYDTVITAVQTDQPLVNPELYVPLDPNASTAAPAEGEG